MGYLNNSFDDSEDSRVAELYNKFEKKKTPKKNKQKKKTSSSLTRVAPQISMKDPALLQLNTNTPISRA